MPHSERAQDQRSARRSPEHAPSRDEAKPARDLHPLLQLQQVAGNQAVQRLARPKVSAAPAMVQRHISPATSVMGTSLHASLMLHHAQLMAHNQSLQQTAQKLGALQQGLNQDQMNALIFTVQAQSYSQGLGSQGAGSPSPAGGGGSGGGYTGSAGGEGLFHGPLLGLGPLGH